MSPASGPLRGQMQRLSRPVILSRLMVHLGKISRPRGKHVLFVEGSSQLDPGEKAGLGGPRGVGRTWTGSHLASCGQHLTRSSVRQAAADPDCTVETQAQKQPDERERPDRGEGDPVTDGSLDVRMLANWR